MELTGLQVGLLVAGLLLNMVPKFQVLPKYFVTLYHEAGHAFASLITGGGLLGIRVEKDGSGSTTTSHRSGFKGFFSVFFTKVSGYPAPAFWGVFFVVSALHLDYTGLLISVGLVSLVNILFSRSLFTLFISILSVIFPVSVILIKGLQDSYYFVLNYYIFFGSLIFFGVFKTIKELFDITRLTPHVETDAFLLSRDTGINLWVCFVIILLNSILTLFGVVGVVYFLNMV